MPIYQVSRKLSPTYYHCMEVLLLIVQSSQFHPIVLYRWSESTLNKVKFYIQTRCTFLKTSQFPKIVLSDASLTRLGKRICGKGFGVHCDTEILRSFWISGTLARLYVVSVKYCSGKPKITPALECSFLISDVRLLFIASSNLNTISSETY